MKMFNFFFCIMKRVIGYVLYAAFFMTATFTAKMNIISYDDNGHLFTLLSLAILEIIFSVLIVAEQIVGFAMPTMHVVDAASSIFKMGLAWAGFIGILIDDSVPDDIFRFGLFMYALSLIITVDHFLDVANMVVVFLKEERKALQSIRKDGIKKTE